MNKVLVIGIDSLSRNLLSDFQDELPNLSKLRQKSPEIKLDSIFPPDSIPAWASIYSGLNPAKHGLLYTFDVFESQWQEILSIDNSILQDKTFWDYTSNHGKNVCILFPLLAYPSWPVKGLMVSRSTKESQLPNSPKWMVKVELQTYPQEAVNEYQVPGFLKTVLGVNPGKKKLGLYAQDAMKATLEQAKLGLEISQKCEWDLFFIYFWLLDNIQHFFWRYHDASDPRYPSIGPFKDTIKDFYRLFDEIVGNFIELNPSSTIVILSDHGHGMRPPKTVNINSILKKKGLLSLKENKLGLSPRLREKLKRILLDIVHKYELDHWLLILAKAKIFSSTSKSIYMSSGSVDMERSAAYLSSFAGPKSYQHGGLEIIKENIKEMNYEEFRNLLIKELSELREPKTGEKLILWVCRREELYSGSYLSHYPDVVFELKEGYGVYWDVDSPLIGTAYEHNLAPGGHKGDAVFLLSDQKDRICTRGDMTLMDVAPTILDLLDIDIGDNFNFDGLSIFR